MEDGLEHSWWANMPHELLREVLRRIESSEATWPSRRTVVACAGVCRAWRLVVMEIVNPPQLSSNITFPISLKQPGPREHLLQCFIRRNSGSASQTYYLFLSLSSALADDGKFLLAARKFRRPTCTDYIISLDADMSRENNAYVGKLRSNFLGTKFTIYDSQLPRAVAKITKGCPTKLVSHKMVLPRVHIGNYPVAHISYELNAIGSRGPRRMHCVMDTIPASAIEPGGVAPSQTEFSVSNIDTSFPSFQTNSIRLENSVSEHQSNKKDDVLVLRNKPARWHEQLQCWCLNFHGRVTVASVKNFQLAAFPENGHAGPQEDEVILQFGKVGKDLFTMDYRYPISAFQAFAICLSSFATTVACE
ncbi:tubby-like F-box protein 3 isoform X1 [Cajanus cajan]|uniref:tubby-like F-box protein 3 isoform X1 n=1 Tax=Cajanus cajan TaxID=3821 RepID=UPI00098DAAE8|nr:tubby-like F-box protein 3 isoform X1 [Cajanus cajan]XP_020226766.1 tubby-like F-box protein 3 isoform X1 [Cajanus cajan]